MFLLSAVIVFAEGAPAVVVGHRGDAEEAFVELPPAVVVVVGEADDSAGRVDQAVVYAGVVEAFPGVEEDDGVIPAEVGGLAVEHGDGLGVAELTDVSGFGIGGLILAEPGGFDCACGGEDAVSGEGAAVVEGECGGLVAFGMDALDAALHLAQASERAVFVLEQADDHADPFKGAGKALEEEGSKHDSELPVIHIVLLRAAVVHDRAEEHVLEERVVDVPLDGCAGGGGNRSEVEGIQFPDFIRQCAKAVDLGGEGACDFGFKEGEVVGKAEVASGKGYAGAVLRA